MSTDTKEDNNQSEKKQDNTEPEVIKNQEDTKQGEDTYVYLKPEPIKTLEDAIDRIHIEADFAAKAIGSNTEDAINSFKNAKEVLDSALTQLLEPLSQLKQHANNIEVSSKTLAILPNKVEDKLTPIADKVTQSVTDSIPYLGDQLNKHHKTTAEETKRSINNYLDHLQMSTDTISSQFRKDIINCQKQLTAMTEASSKNRIGRLFWNFLFICSFSAIISGFTSWYINSTFPHTVELYANGKVIVKDAQVLIVDQNNPYNKKEKH